MSAATPSVALSQTLGNATARQAPNTATSHATANATGSLKALALKALHGSTTRQAMRQQRDTPATSHATEGAFCRTPMRQPSGLSWPEPEPGPIETVTPAGRYACLFAIVSVYGAGLTKDTGGRLTIACPTTMPQEAAQAARDGLAELAGYIGGRLQ